MVQKSHKEEFTFFEYLNQLFILIFQFKLFFLLKLAYPNDGLSKFDWESLIKKQDNPFGVYNL